jgi:hypothetical protein
VCSGGCGEWGFPGVAGEGLVERGDDIGAVLAGGVDVAADVEPVLGDVYAGQPAGNLLLCLGGPEVALADVVGGPDPGVGAEAGNVVFAVAAEFQQVSSGVLGGALTWPGQVW